MFFFDDTKKASRELLEVLRQGIDLLANDSLNADLYSAYERYVIATIKLVDSAYWKNYTSMFEEKNSLSSYQSMNSAKSSQFQMQYPYQTSLESFGYNQQQGFNPFTHSVNYKEELKILLKKVIAVIGELLAE